MHVSQDWAKALISIHAPHEGERLSNARAGRMKAIFQSTLPTRGSDLNDPEYLAAKMRISIHAPHEGERRSTYTPRRTA